MPSLGRLLQFKWFGRNPFIDAVGTEKSNKHLVVVVDSCYSGILAEDLDLIFEKQAEKWLYCYSTSFV